MHYLTFTAKWRRNAFLISLLRYIQWGNHFVTFFVLRVVFSFQDFLFYIMKYILFKQKFLSTLRNTIAVGLCRMRICFFFRIVLYSELKYIYFTICQKILIASLIFIHNGFVKSCFSRSTYLPLQKEKSKVFALFYLLIFD